MPTGIYKLSNGQIVVGTTTVLSRFKDSNALIHWAWTCGRDGKDYRQERDKAGEQGTSVHDLAEKHIHKQEYEIPDDAKVKKAFAKFVEWWDQQEYEIVWSEKQMVCETHKFGGCPDLLVKDKEGNHILIDFKTGKRIYSDTCIQLGAYSWLINVNDDIRVKKGIIVRLPKNNSKIELKEFSIEQLNVGWNQFTLFREAYNNNEIIERYFKKGD
jgi:D-alanyl-D-alanine carboxypeptidase|tara:strand:- start:14 stop:655 length:642 start_codon:yes stop_codon:yes gene_type:complete